jgi:hypothetical protein
MAIAAPMVFTSSPRSAKRMSRAIEQIQANLSEALRLMEPVAETSDDNPRYISVVVPMISVRAISDFVKRMKGETNATE